MSEAVHEGKRSAAPRRGVARITFVVLALAVIALIVLGTKVVPIGSAAAQTQAKFDAASFGAEHFPEIQKSVTANAVDATTLAAAIDADPQAAAKKYGKEGSSGPVYSVTFSGVVGEAQSGIAPVTVPGLPTGLQVRVQFGPAVNGTDLRDATGDITFGQFTNQIDYQNAASAINDQLKAAVLTKADATSLTGKTVTVTGAFTLVNPASWLVTPIEVKVG